MLPVLSISGAKVIQFLNKLLILAENFYYKLGKIVGGLPDIWTV